MQNAAAEEQRLAVQAAGLYLANLLVAPGLAFVALLWLARRLRGSEGLAASHVREAIRASVWAGCLLVLVAVVIALLGGFSQPATWIVLILYVICCHSALLLFGVIDLVKALNGQRWRYPLPGGRR